MKKFILSIILAIILIASPASAEFFRDVIVTSPNGIWTDSRAYTTLNAAITAVGANERTIKIVSPQTVTTLTVPANVTLSFERDGSIANSGQLTINTKNIIAPNRQIFTGAGDIDFASGSVVRTGWFLSTVKAFDVTNNDELTLIISKSAFITANCAVGDNVSLKWESARNRLTANGGFTLSNIKNIEAGNYQLFAGAGDFDFLNGAELYLKWFARLSSVLTWVESEEVTIIVNEDSNVQADVTATPNEGIKVVNGGKFNIDAGVILTINGPFDAGLYQVFSGAGSVVFGATNISTVYPEWWYSGVGYWTAAIQSAFDSIISLPDSPGIVKIMTRGNLEVDDEITISNLNRIVFKAGSRSTRLQQVTDNKGIIVTDNCDWCEFSDISLQSIAVSPGNAITLGGGSTKTSFKNIYFYAWDKAITTDNSHACYGVIDNCRFSNNLVAIDLVNTIYQQNAWIITSPWIEDATFAGSTTGIQINGAGVTIKGGTLEGLEYGIKVPSTNALSRGISIEGVYFEANSHNILLAEDGAITGINITGNYFKLDSGSRLSVSAIEGGGNNQVIQNAHIAANTYVGIGTSGYNIDLGSDFLKASFVEYIDLSVVNLSGSGLAYNVLQTGGALQPNGYIATLTGDVDISARFGNTWFLNPNGVNRNITPTAGQWRRGAFIFVRNTGAASLIFDPAGLNRDIPQSFQCGFAFDGNNWRTLFAYTERLHPRGADAVGTNVMGGGAGALGVNTGFIQITPGKYVPYWTTYNP